MTSRIALGAALAGAVALGAVVTAFGNAAGDDQGRKSARFSDADQEEIRDIVEDFLMEHPEVIIDAVNAYAERERVAQAESAEKAMSELLPTLISDEAAFVSGPNPAGATVAVVEFFDYHCGFCKRANGIVRELTSGDPAVKIVFRELPIIRQESQLAARYSLAAREQDKYLDYHFALMGASGTLTEERLKEFAKLKGLDVDKLTKTAKSTEIDMEVQRNIQMAREMNVDGTPTWIVVSADGSFKELISGFREDDLRAAIKKAKAAKPAKAAAGQ